MQNINDIDQQWLPRVSFIVLCYTLLPVLLIDNSGLFLILTGPLLCVLVILSGIITVLQCGGQCTGILLFFRRPANLITLLRSLFVLGGIVCGLLWINAGNSLLSWTAVILTALGFFADWTDGLASRREKVKSHASAWGSWYDRESDSILLFFTSLAIASFEGIPLYVIIPGICRYAFALIFGLFPADCRFPLWFNRFSKTAAAVFQTVTVVLWSTILLATEIRFLSDTLPYQITYIIPANLILILSSFIIELYYRVQPHIHGNVV